MLCCIILNKKLKKWVSPCMDTLEKVAWILIFFMASIKLNYGDIFSSPNKLEFGDSDICMTFLIMKQKIINNCPSDTLIFLKSNFECWNNLCFWSTAGNYKHLSNWRQCITSETYLFIKTKTFIFKHSVMVFWKSTFENPCKL